MFKYIVLLSALALAVCSAIFSVTGFSQMFVGAPVLSGLAFAALEVAKLVSVSFLYRYETIPKLLRRYMLSGAIGLTLITSFGIYGYFSAAYAVGSADIQSKISQTSTYQSQLENINIDQTRLVDRLNQLQQIRTQQENRLDVMVSTGKNTSVQQRVIRNQDIEIVELQKQISALSRVRDSVSSIKNNVQNSIATTGKLGSLYYIANTFGLSLDVVMKWFIFIIVLVFDPMSVSLFLAYNYIVKKSNVTDVTNVTELETLKSSNLSEQEATDSQNLSENAAVLTPPEGSGIDSGESNPPRSDSDIPNDQYYRNPTYEWVEGGRWQNDPAALAWKKELGG